MLAPHGMNQHTQIVLYFISVSHLATVVLVLIIVSGHKLVS